MVVDGSQLLSWRLAGGMADDYVCRRYFPLSPLERINYNHKKKTEIISITFPHRLGEGRSGERYSFPGPGIIEEKHFLQGENGTNSH